MKAILVIETPKDCGHCQLSDFVDGDNCLCRIADRKNNATEKPKWCPLKPMPEWKISGEVAFDSTGGIIYDDEVYGLVKEILNDNH